jgi:N-acetylglucosaminyldiphosphoundecaprenol N-acetyl-beta-D-mannosaminyltransferase
VIQCSSHSISELLRELRLLLAGNAAGARTILCVNAHIYNLAVRDRGLRRRLNAARICAADGMAIVWVARCFGGPLRERCNMTEAFTAFLNEKQTPPTEAVLVGCTPAEAQAAADRINALASQCRVSLSCSGFLSDEEYRSFFAACRDTRLVLVGMGSPRSEAVAELAAEICTEAAVWHIGGGTIRILAGTMHEAPSAWRRLGLQWLHRLASDPIALWRRYLIGNPLFAARILIAGMRGEVGKRVD